jgi:hypothetical protein
VNINDRYRQLPDNDVTHCPRNAFGKMCHSFTRGKRILATIADVDLTEVTEKLF